MALEGMGYIEDLSSRAKAKAKTKAKATVIGL
jgi:hypothetical protein